MGKINPEEFAKKVEELSKDSKIAEKSEQWKKENPEKLKNADMPGIPSHTPLNAKQKYGYQPSQHRDLAEEKPSPQNDNTQPSNNTKQGYIKRLQQEQVQPPSPAKEKGMERGK